MEDNTNIKVTQLSELLKRFALKAYSSKIQEEEDEKIMEICISLWKLDYKCEIVENKCGILCSTYPSKIVIPLHEVEAGEIVNTSPLSKAIMKNLPKKEKKELSNDNDNKEDKLLENLLDVKFLPAPTFSSEVRTPTKRTDVENRYPDGGKISGTPCIFTFKEYLKIANLARCRYRFPVPSILCKGKYVSRSATLSCLIDVLGKQILHSVEAPPDIEDESSKMPRHSNDLDRARFYDIKLLEAIGTTSIMDLMVENKKLKYTIPVSSSEKADSENRYHKFNINSIPYPGCEFFKEFSNKNFNSTNLHYNWDPQFNDTKLSLAEEKISPKIANDWSSYKEWDLRTMTENYLKLILRYIVDEDSKETGFLVHCISGWDRTPLFISLIRLSLWADGLVHCSLNARQMLYFTLAYDWYLFGHQLPDRIKADENILYFCFEFLDVMSYENFMDSNDKRERHPSNGSSASASGAYDSATDGIETPLSSFGSATSLASSSSNPSVAPCGPNIKVSVTKPTTSSSETSLWPFNKENGFSFDGISDNESSRNFNEDCENVGPGNASVLTRRSPVRSPLKERNKGSPKSISSPSSKKSSGGRKSGNLNGVLKEFAGRRSRKSSSAESPNAKVQGSETSESTGQEIAADADCGVGVQAKEASKPVPVPGVRSRHSSSSSSMGSWQFLSTSESLNESFSFPLSLESHKSSRTSLTADMIDSTHTIKEETSPSSSLESGHSIIVFNRHRRLMQVKDTFMKMYKREVAPLYPEGSFLYEIVSNIYSKLGT